jgi:hypothetical protein
MKLFIAPQGQGAQSADQTSLFVRSRPVKIILAAALLGAPAAALAQAPASTNVQRTQFIAVQDAEFQKMDSNKDGKLTRVEIETYQRTRGAAQAAARNKALFAALDADHNGQLSPAEFAKLPTSVPTVDARPMMATLDQNHDGSITLIENRAGKLAYFDKIDTDKDGVVTAAEMKAAGVIK